MREGRTQKTQRGWWYTEQKWLQAGLEDVGAVDVVMSRRFGVAGNL